VYDALSTLASSVHSALAEPNIVQLFVPPLLSKWQARMTARGLPRVLELTPAASAFASVQTMSPGDFEQLPLLETLTAVIPCLGVSFQPYAAPVFQRCLALAQQQLHNKQAGDAGPDYEPEFVVRRPRFLAAPPPAAADARAPPRLARWMW
jgi:transportin-1